MLKVILQAPRYIPPFNEPARDLRIQNKPLWLNQRDLLAPYVDREMELSPGENLPSTDSPMIVYRDNLFFDKFFIDEFMRQARTRGRPVRAAFSVEDMAFREHALPLASSYTQAGNLYLADLWYYPRGPETDVEPLVIDMQAREIGYYHVPTYMATDSGDLVYQVGKDCVIDPSAIIIGPTTIGDNVTIGAGAVIDNCIIGSNVNISQGCQLMLSVIGDGTFLPFRASLFMTTIMEHSMVAQNTCLQMCVIGRSTFIGAGNTFTDYNLIPVPIRARNGQDELAEANRPVLGGCVGHNCRIGAGLVIFPARTIESDVLLFGSKDRRVIERDVRYEESDHHVLKNGAQHPRLYPRRGGQELTSW
jgi:carbonic anhydrase/acetyltransferase-like protein (isoleucine patch superfamily)